MCKHAVTHSEYTRTQIGVDSLSKQNLLHVIVLYIESSIEIVFEKSDKVLKAITISADPSLFKSRQIVKY